MKFINSRLESNGDGTYNIVYFDDDDGLDVQDINLQKQNNMRMFGGDLNVE